MSTTSIILLVIGLVVLVQSLIILSFPKCSLKCCKKFGFKSEKRLKKIATWELIVAIILIIVAINI